MLTTRLAERFRQLGRADDGQALVLGAVGLIVLVLMAGLGVDVGYLRYEKLQMQKAADASAIAGASALIYGGQVQVAAKNDSAANGFADGNNGVSVKVNNPPASGPFAGNTAYVEVIVAQATPTFFMRVGGFDSVNVSSRAVATSIASSSGCIFALDPTDAGSLIVEGRVNVNSNCGIRVNSTSAAAFEKRGSGDITVSPPVAGIGIVGDVELGGSGTIDPTPVTGIPGFGDPLANVPAPPVGDCNYHNFTVAPGKNTLSQGVYCGGITVSNWTGPVTFNPGTYVLLGGGLTVSGGRPVITGDGVTFYNTQNAQNAYGPISLTASAGTNLSAPTSGTLEGILFFQDRGIVSNSTSNFDASHEELYTGALYFPTTPVRYTGSATFPPYTIIDAWKITMVGTSAINNIYTSLSSGGSPIRSAALVE
jgi:Flp pilus assembly protein TadG